MKNDLPLKLQCQAEIVPGVALQRTGLAAVLDFDNVQHGAKAQKNY